MKKTPKKIDPGNDDMATQIPSITAESVAALDGDAVTVAVHAAARADHGARPRNAAGQFARRCGDVNVGNSARPRAVTAPTAEAETAHPAAHDATGAREEDKTTTDALGCAPSCVRRAEIADASQAQAAALVDSGHASRPPQSSDASATTASLLDRLPRLAEFPFLFSLIKRFLERESSASGKWRSGQREGFAATMPQVGKRLKYSSELLASTDLDDETWVRNLALLTGIPETSEQFTRDALITRRYRALFDVLAAEVYEQEHDLWHEHTPLTAHPFLRKLGELVDMCDPTLWRVCDECSQWPERSYARVHCRACFGSGYLCA